jgi:hypothetical protein
MDCRTLGGFQACLCGTSGYSAKLLCQGREAGGVTPRLSWFQRRGPSRWRLPRSHISYPREKFSTPIMRSSVWQLFRSAYALLHLPTPRDPVTLPHRDASLSTQPSVTLFRILLHHSNLARVPCLHIIAGQLNHRELRVRADRGKALALDVLIHPCFESFALRRLFEARRRRSLACHSHTKKSSPRGGPLIQPHPEFSVLTCPNSRRHTPGLV